MVGAKISRVRDYDISVRTDPILVGVIVGVSPRRRRRRQDRTQEVAAGYSGLPEDPNNAPSTSLSMLAISSESKRKRKREREREGEDEGLRNPDRRRSLDEA